MAKNGLGSGQPGLCRNKRPVRIQRLRIRQPCHPEPPCLCVLLGRRVPGLSLPGHDCVDVYGRRLYGVVDLTEPSGRERLDPELFSRLSPQGLL